MRTYQIMLDDDEPGIRIYCRYVLQAEGMFCDEAESGEEALQMLHRKNYDLVLLDINMGPRLGTEVCRELRDKPPCPNLKIIMASGNVNTDTMSHMLLQGADDFITKPFSVA